MACGHPCDRIRAITLSYPDRSAAHSHVKKSRSKVKQESSDRHMDERTLPSALSPCSLKLCGTSAFIYVLNQNMLPAFYIIFCQHNA